MKEESTHLFHFKLEIGKKPMPSILVQVCKPESNFPELDNEELLLPCGEFPKTANSGTGGLYVAPALQNFQE